MKKNTIVYWIKYGEDFDPALIPRKNLNVKNGIMGSAFISIKLDEDVYVFWGTWRFNISAKEGQIIITPADKPPVLRNYQYVAYEDIEVKPD